MGTVISNLKARFGVDTSDFKKGLKDGERATADFKGAAGGILDEFASMFGVNMSGVTSAIGTANKSLSFLGQSFKAAKTGSEAFAVGLKVLKFALIATGIGALVVVLGSVIAYFTKSGSGADKFAKILMQMRSVLNNVVERLVAFGKGVVDFVSGRFAKGIEGMGAAFKGMGTEIKEDWKAAGLLSERMEALEDKEIALINSLAERRAKIEELKRLSREETEDYRKRLELIGQTEKLIKSAFGDEIKLERERLAIMREKIALASTDPTDDQNREVAEQQAKVNELLGRQATELTALLRLKNSTLAVEKKAFAQFNDFSKLKVPALLDAKVYENLKRSLEGLHHTLISVKESTSALFDVMGEVAIDATEAVNNAFGDMASGMGEFLGALMSGDAGMKDFGKMIASTFADLAITVGKIAIGAGMAVLGVKQALMTLNPYLAIGAGVALIAIGMAVKGSLKSAAGGSGGGSASISGSGGGAGSSVYDTRGATPQQTINITGKLVAEGPDLVYVFNQENTRRNVVNGR